MHDSVSGRKRVRKVSVREAQRILTEEEANKLLDVDTIVDDAMQRAEQTGVVFIDEIDKIAGSSIDTGPDVSGQGVQRDLLPIVEGLYRSYAVRAGEDRPHAVHRGGRIPRQQAFGPHTRVTGTLPLARGTGQPGREGPLLDPCRA